MATPAEQLERGKRKRTILRTSTTRLLTKLEKELQKKEADFAGLEETLAQLSEKDDALSALDKEVEDLISDLEQLETEVASREVYKEKIIAVRTRATRRLREDSSTSGSNNGGNSEHETNSTVATAKVKLPRLTIEKFHGDACSWQNFWAQYKASIHENGSLVEVDKFNYLKSYLGGVAANAISGLPLTAENYKKAIKILSDRFGRKDIIVNAHMNKLLTLNPVKKADDIQALRNLYDDCEIQIRSLETMGMTSDAYGGLLCPLLFKVIPDELSLEFNRRRDESGELTVSELLAYIRREVESRERTLLLAKKVQPEEGSITAKHSERSVRPTRQEPASSKGSRAASAAALNAVIEDVCIFCEGTAPHKTDECAAHSIAEKKVLLRDRGRCYVCLKKRHLARNCRSNIVCPVCQKRHRKALCYKTYPEIKSPKEAVVASVVPNFEQKKGSIESVLLQTVQVVAVGVECDMKVRGLLDGGSQRTFIREDLSRKLQLPVVGKENLKLHTFGMGTVINSERRRVKLTLRNPLDKNKTIEIEALEAPEICSALIQFPSQHLRKIMTEQNIQLSDDHESGDRNYHLAILIGSDYYWRIVSGQMKRLSDSLMLIETLFGWSIQGPMTTSEFKKGDEVVAAMKIVVNKADSEEQSVSAQLKMFWELDSLGIIEKPESRSISDDEALNHFEKTVSFRNGRYEVRLPWKSEDFILPDNFEIAKKRLVGLVQRFRRNPCMYAEYKEIIEDQIEQGIVEEVSDDDIKADGKRPLFYLPHQAVIKNEKATTKMRVVFDASSHEKGAPSLNDLLHPGPNMNPDLLTLIVKFRRNAVAFAADIEKAFLQIQLAVEDRDAVRFLWIEHLANQPGEEIKIKIMRMTRVLFGVTCSPFLLAAVIKHHVAEQDTLYPSACESLNNSLFVDDLLDGATNATEAFTLSSDTKLVLNKANMSLRKWRTNSNTLKEKWEVAGFDTIDSTLAIGEEPLPFKVLGLSWATQDDTFRFDVSALLDFLIEGQNTKRGILQASGRIFDPVGFLSPFTIIVKMLFQSLWARGLQWDEELPEEIQKEWNTWCLDLPILHQVTIPRYYFRDSEANVTERVQLHCFTDASEKAYGAVIYLRYSIHGEEMSVTLVASKTRVAPLKKLSVPRLELMGALIGARLMAHLKEAFQPFPEISFQFWTDSMIALSWIRSSSSQWKPFIGNRIREIQSLSEPENWRHCPGVDNPADILTRGQYMSELVGNQIWWNGPDWLKSNESQWPKLALDKVAEIKDHTEMRAAVKNVSVCVATAAAETPLFELKRHSSLSKTLRVTAWIQRFIHNARSPDQPRTSSLQTAELKLAEIYWIKIIQRQFFLPEMKALESGQEVQRTSRIVNVNPFLCEDGLMRIGGRLQYSALSYDEKHPILLPDRNEFSVLLIKDSHLRVAHCGVADTLAQLRGRFWILRARQLAKTVINDCLICRRSKVKPSSEIMAPLPGDRIQPSPPFEVTGVDFAGPIYARISDGSGKTYIALFTCAVTRAVHLELVSDLTTEMFILAFKRFISRRGVCRVIYSDNAKTFKGAERELRDMWSSIKLPELETFFGSQGITWRYIVERAAWWGGFWERMVRTIKACLKKVLGRACLTFEELTTILTQIEAVVNSRPMTYTYSSTDEPTPLTPSHFLIGKRLTALPDMSRTTAIKETTTTRQQFQARLKYRNVLLSHFWTQWKNQYLLELRSAHFRTPLQKAVGISEGDVVLISEPRTPRFLWKMGRVENTFRGRDDKVRSCSVCLPDKTVLKRPIQLLYPLEVKSADSKLQETSDFQDDK